MAFLLFAIAGLLPMPRPAGAIAAAFVRAALVRAAFVAAASSQGVRYLMPPQIFSSARLRGSTRSEKFFNVRALSS